MNKNITLILILGILTLALIAGCAKVQEDKGATTGTTIDDTEVQNTVNSEIDSGMMTDTDDVEIGEMF